MLSSLIGLVQVWFMDNNGYYTGDTKLVKEVPENSTTCPLMESFIKPKFNGKQWIEGADKDELVEYNFVENRTLESLQAIKQEKNKVELAKFLAEHPVLWIDGNYYGITFDDQLEMSLDLNVYNLKQSMGFSNWKLEWHNTKKACREFELEEFLGLLNLITDTVFPYRSYCESVKEAIYSCTTKEELEAIKIDYNSVVIEIEEEPIQPTAPSEDKNVDTPIEDIIDNNVEDIVEDNAGTENTEDNTEDIVEDNTETINPEIDNNETNNSEILDSNKENMVEDKAL